MQSLVAGVLSLAALAANVADADMIYTGGSLSSLGSQTVITGPGSFDVHGVRNEWVEVAPGFPIYAEVATGDAEVLLAADSLSLWGGATGYGLPWTPRYEGSVSGSIEFDVSEPTQLWLDWDFVGDLHETTVSIFDEQGERVVACVGAVGCGGQPGLTGLWVSFEAGHYQLDFSSHNEWGPGTGPMPNQFSLTLSPVPLPAAAWLLLSGLGGLAVFRRRQAA